jgi:hypothetical protein
MGAMTGALLTGMQWSAPERAETGRIVAWSQDKVCSQGERTGMFSLPV